MLLEVFRRVLLHRPADLADEDDALGPGIGEEDFDDVDVLCAGEGVAAYTDGQGLAKAGERGLAGATASAMPVKRVGMTHLTASYVKLKGRIVSL